MGLYNTFSQLLLVKVGGLRERQGDHEATGRKMNGSGFREMKGLNRTVKTALHWVFVDWLRLLGIHTDSNTSSTTGLAVK